MDAKQILVRARDLLSDQTRWCKGIPYADLYGDYSPTLEGARCYCAIGAIQAVAGVPACPMSVIERLLRHSNFELSQAAYQLEAAAFRLEGTGITRVNDYYGYDATMRCYDHAIADADAFVEGSAV